MHGQEDLRRRELKGMRNKGLFEPAKDGSLANIIGILKDCTSMKDLNKGSELHAHIRQHKFLGDNVYIGSILVNMYAKCGALSKAQRVLEELPVRDVVTWNALIAGYAQQGQGEEALKCFDDMLCEGHCPTAVTFACALKACGGIKAGAKGKEIHDKIVSLGMVEKDVVLGTALVDMYVKCSAFAKAQQVLQELPFRDVVCWSALIAGYAEQGQGWEALKCFDDMLDDGHTPTAVTFISVLKACGSIRATAKGEEIHDRILRLGMLEKDIVLGTALVDMYVKCGAHTKAQWVVEELPVCDVVTWNVLIAGYVQRGQGEEALKCFDDMLHEGHSPDVVTFISALKACWGIGAAAKGEEIHHMIVSLGMLKEDVVLGNSLVNMYAKCGSLLKAQQVLRELPVRDVVTWNALIAGYAEQGQGEKALKCFDDMLCDGHCPTVVTFACVLKACGSIKAAARGEEIHEMIISLGMLEKHTVLGTTLMDMYVKCGVFDKARRLLEELSIRDVVSWNVLIAGYAEQGQGDEALKCFDDMLHEGHTPSAVTFACTLKACGNIGAVAKGEEIHEKIVCLDMLENNMVLGTTLVDMYVKCNALTKAQEVFEELPIRDVVSWSVLIAGYAEQGQGENALKCFDDMLYEGHSPDAFSFSCILNACGKIGSAVKGEQIHDKIISLGLLERNIVLGTTLLDMYAKYGVITKAQQVLEELAVHSVASWSALIAGYAHQGQSVEAVNCFEKMQSRGVQPNSVTLTSMLNACSHSGLLDQAETYFSEMSTKYGIHPNLEHYCCMTDLFSRAGKFKRALSVITEMPSDKCLPWVALLRACCKVGNVNVGEVAFAYAVHLDKSNAATYVLMADIYAAAGMQEDVTIP